MEKKEHARRWQYDGLQCMGGKNILDTNFKMACLCNRLSSSPVLEGKKGSLMHSDGEANVWLVIIFCLVLWLTYSACTHACTHTHTHARTHAHTHTHAFITQ